MPSRHCGDRSFCVDRGSGGNEGMGKWGRRFSKVMVIGGPQLRHVRSVRPRTMRHSMNSLLSMSFRVSAATLRASPFRTFLSTLGIVIGVASLVAVLSLGDGMQQYVRRQVNETTDLQAIGVNPQTTRTVDGVAVPLDSVVQWGAADATRSAPSSGRAPPRARPVHSRRSPSRRMGGVRCVSSARCRVCSSRSGSRSRPAVRSPTPTPPGMSSCCLLRRHVRSRGEARRRCARRRRRLNQVPFTLIGVTRRAADDTKLVAIVPIGATRALVPPRVTWTPSLTVHAETVEDVRACAPVWSAGSRAATGPRGRSGSRWRTAPIASRRYSRRCCCSSCSWARSRGSRSSSAGSA